MPPEIIPVAAVIAAPAAEPVVVAPVATVQETVAAAVAVSAAIETAAAEINRPATDEQRAEFAALHVRLDTVMERLDALGSTVVTAAVATMELVEETVAEAEEIPAVVLPPVEPIPPESVPAPQAPEIRTKKKRHFL